MEGESVGFCSSSCCNDYISRLSPNLRARFLEVLTLFASGGVTGEGLCIHADLTHYQGHVVCRDCGITFEERVFDVGPEFSRNEGISYRRDETQHEFYISILSNYPRAD